MKQLWTLKVCVLLVSFHAQHDGDFADSVAGCEDPLPHKPNEPSGQYNKLTSYTLSHACHA